MFSDKQKQSWQSIKAPDGLLEKIENAAEMTSAKPKSFKRIAFPLIAASLMFIFVAVLVIGKTSNVDIYLNDSLLTRDEYVIDMSYQPMMVSRSVSDMSSLTFSVDIESDTLVKTEIGEFSVVTEDGEEIYKGNEYTLQDKSILIWTYPLQSEVCELILECGMNESVVSVEYDEFNARQIVKCYKN